ncbi:MAG: hypothetical protein HY293_03095 [Planctomycetes bacterium]|nr:hypothetical protein [Planctomycetota bacterium]
MRARLCILVLPFLVSCEASRLERAGELNCRKGRALLTQCEKWSRQGVLSDNERARVRNTLREGLGLLREGLRAYAELGELTHTKYDLDEDTLAFWAGARLLTSLEQDPDDP